MLTKEGFLSLVKGCIIGITSLIEGISYGSMITTLGLQNDVVEAVNKIPKKENKKLSQIVIPVLIGILLITIASINLIPIIMEKYKNQAIFLGLGLMLGGYKLLSEKTKEKITIKKGLVMLIIIALITLSQTLLLNNTIKIGTNIILYLFLGLLTGITILVPGIKEHFWIALFDKKEYIEAWTINDYFEITLFIIGALIGVIAISKIVYYFMKNYKNKTNLVIKALLLSAIIISIFELEKFTLNFVNIFTTILAFLWGYILVKNLEKE